MLFREFGSRPRIRIEPTFSDRVIESAALIGLLFSIANVALQWPSIPNRVPVRFDLTGYVETWGSKYTVLMTLAICAICYAILTAISRFPYTFHYPAPITENNAERQYRIVVMAMRWLKMELVWIFAFYNWQIIQVAVGNAEKLNPFFMPFTIAAIIATIAVVTVRLINAR